MDYLQQKFSVRFEYRVFFTENLFSRNNPLFRDFLYTQKTDTPKKLFFVIDSGVVQHHPQLRSDITEYFRNENSFVLIQEFMIVPGGEVAKNNEQLFYNLVNAVDKHGIDRHSYIIAIGGARSSTLWVMQLQCRTGG